MKTILAFCFSIITISAIAQNKLAPATWSFQITESGDDLIFTATAELDSGWAVYSQHTEEGGPVPLSFSYSDESILIGNTEERSDAIKKYSELFEVEVVKFKKQAVFEQKFKRTQGMKSFSGELKFMCCDDLRCLPPTVVQFDIGL